MKKANLSKSASPTIFELAQLAASLKVKLHDSITQKPTLDDEVKAWKFPNQVRLECSAWDGYVHSAYDLWESAKRVRESRECANVQLEELRDGVLTFSAEEWKARMMEYGGFNGDVDRMLDASVLPVEDLARHLYRNNGTTRQNRLSFLVGLIKFAVDHDVKFSDGKTPWLKHTAAAEASFYTVKGDGMAKSHISLRDCRYFVEARHVQLKIMKKRIVPASKFNR